MSKRGDKEFLLDIKEAIKRIRSYTVGMNFDGQTGFPVFPGMEAWIQGFSDFRAWVSLALISSTMSSSLKSSSHFPRSAV